MKKKEIVSERAFVQDGRDFGRKLVEEAGGKGIMFVPVSHQELDSLVGRLMQMCDLTGDQEQRKALKSTIKQIARDWLDDEYSNLGYDKWTGLRDGTAVASL